MDAGIVLTTPQAQPPSGADTSSDVSREDAEAFAAHLPQEAQGKPPQRKPLATDKEDAAQEKKDDAATAPPPAPSFSLSSPVAPVLVREDGAPAVLDIALTPSTPSATPQTQAPVAPDAAAALALAAAVAATTGAPVKDVGAPAAPTTAPVAATPPAPEDAAAAAPAPTTAPANTGAPFMLPGAEALAASAAPQAKPAPDPATESLRNAGRPRGAKAEAQADARPVTAPSAAAAATAQPGAKPEFIAASATPATTADTAPQPTATGEAAAVSLEARRAAEAPPVAVHRPPTVAATVAQHVIRRFDGKSTSIDVRLDPAELGRVSVKLEVGPDSRVTAIVAAENPATLSDLMRSSRELERALESAGLELTPGGLSFDLSDRSSGDRAPTPDAGATNARAGNDNAATDAPAATSRPFGLESWRGVRVDVTV